MSRTSGQFSLNPCSVCNGRGCRLCHENRYRSTEHLERDQSPHGALYLPSTRGEQIITAYSIYHASPVRSIAYQTTIGNTASIVASLEMPQSPNGESLKSFESKFPDFSGWIDNLSRRVSSSARPGVASRVNTRSLVVAHANGPNSSPVTPHVDPGRPQRGDELVIQPPRRRARPPGMGLRVLSFDGGGCRGYASLLILRNLLRLEKPDGQIFPYLYFDLICGTSTGGLIAILLAILHLDIDTAISVFGDLGPVIFSNNSPKLSFWVRGAQYDHKSLENEISKILARYGGGRTLMYEPAYDRGCLCFVTTTQCVNRERLALCVRSYHIPKPTIPHGYLWSIMEAALATSAAPTFFERCKITVGRDIFEFEDAGANGVNNPTMLARKECNDLDDSRGPLYLSIGTGTRGLIHERGYRRPARFQTLNNLFSLLSRTVAQAKAFGRYATDVEETHKEMLREQSRADDISYYRLNPPSLGVIGLSDYTANPIIQMHVEKYCESEASVLQKCAFLLRMILPNAEDLSTTESPLAASRV